MTYALLSVTGLFALVIATQIQLGDSFSCYQCNSTTHAQCLEYFDHEYSTLKSSECAVADAKHCIKVTGVWGGVVGTYRFCSSRDLGNQCQYFNFDDHDRRYRACVRTCNTDHCNSSQSLRPGLSTLLSLLALWSLIKLW